MRSKAAHSSDCAFGFTSSKIEKCAMNKFGINDQVRNDLFLDRHPSFFIRKSHGECLLRTFVNGVNGVNKAPQFLLFQLPEALAHLSIAEG
jgi:hypothetical protein